MIVSGKSNLSSPSYRVASTSGLQTVQRAMANVPNLSYKVLCCRTPGRGKMDRAPTAGVSDSHQTLSARTHQAPASAFEIQGHFFTFTYVVEAEL